MKYQHILDLHTKQEYSSLDGSIPYERLIKHAANFPKEALYIIDCKTVEIDVLTSNFGSLIGVQKKGPHHISDIYDHIHRDDLEDFVNYNHKIVSACFANKFNYIPEQDIFMSSYKTSDGRILLRSTAALIKDKNGKMRYSVGRITDITGLVNSKGFRFKVTGPNEKEIYSIIHEVEDLNPIVSKRELEILVLLSKGYTSKMIGKKLFISIHTVNTHRKNIIKKLEASGSIDAYRKAIDFGLIC